MRVGIERFLSAIWHSPDAQSSDEAMKHALLLLSLLVACGDDAPDSLGTVDAAAGDDSTMYVGCPATTPAFALGMSARVVRGSISAQVVEATAVPPRLFLNDWTVQFSGADGRAADDVTITKATPYMPIHMHSGNVPVAITKLDQLGTFKVEHLNLWMRGPWEIQLTLNSASGEGYVIFDVCIQE